MCIKLKKGGQNYYSTLGHKGHIYVHIYVHRYIYTYTYVSIHTYITYSTLGRMHYPTYDQSGFHSLALPEVISECSSRIEL